MMRIVVPISGATTDEVLSRSRSAQLGGADVVELRLDRCLSAGCEAQGLLKAISRLALPAIVTCRHHSEGGSWRGPESERMDLLDQADRLGASWIDLEIEQQRAWRPRCAKLILSAHDFTGMGSDLPSLVRRMRQQGADVAKIAVTARDAADLALIAELYRQGDGPLVAIAMGEAGLASRLLAGVWGAAFTFARLDDDQGSAPGQPTLSELAMYRVKTHGPQTRILGIIGSPVSHSLSPLIHNAAFAQQRIDAVYVPFRVEDARSFWRACGGWIDGLSITLPHKQALLEEVDECELPVTSLGTANTIYRSETGASVAANTDAPAITSCVEMACGSLAGRQVLVLGAGGVSRTAALACLARGAKVLITNRTLDRAQALGAEIGCPVIPWETSTSTAFEILINGTSVGMGTGQEEVTPWPAHAHRRGSVVFDTVYTPLETRLLRDAQAAGATTVCGLDMFIAQAVGQFERWTAVPAPEHLMYRLALEQLDPHAVTTAQGRHRSTTG